MKEKVRSETSMKRMKNDENKNIKKLKKAVDICWKVWYYITRR